VSLIIATAIDCILPRGKNKTLRFQIMDEDIDVIYNLANHSVYLVMMSSRVGNDPPVVEKEGNVFAAAEGKVEFIFTGEDTEDLMARSYDADIIVVDDNTAREWPAFQGKLAVVATAERGESGG